MALAFAEGQKKAKHKAYTLSLQDNFKLELNFQACVYLTASHIKD